MRLYPGGSAATYSVKGIGINAAMYKVIHHTLRKLCIPCRTYQYSVRGSTLFLSKGISPVRIVLVREYSNCALLFFCIVISSNEKLGTRINSQKLGKTTCTRAKSPQSREGLPYSGNVSAYFTIHFLDEMNTIAT